MTMIAASVSTASRRPHVPGKATRQRGLALLSALSLGALALSAPTLAAQSPRRAADSLTNRARGDSARTQRLDPVVVTAERSEERRVGKECRFRGAASQEKKKEQQ